MTILTWGTLVKRRFNKATYKLKQAFPDAPHRTSLTPTWIAKTSNCSNSGSCRMSDIFPPLINLTELVCLCSNFGRFASKYLNIESPTKRMRSEEYRSVMSLLSRKEDWLVTVGAGEGSSQAASKAATLEETCELVHVDHSRLIPMYNARFILWPPSLSSPIRKKLVNGQMPEMRSQPLKQSLCLATQSQLRQSIATNHEIRNKKFQNFTSILR